MQPLDGSRPDLFAAYKLSKIEEDILQSLLEFESISKNYLAEKNGIHDQEDNKIEIIKYCNLLKVYICKIRKKISVSGADVKNVRNIGYRLTDESKAAILALTKLK